MKETTTSPTRLTSKGQVVIPRALRQRLGWKPGTKLQAETAGKSVTLRRMRGGKAAAWLEEVAGCVTQGDPVGSLEQEHRREVESDAHGRP